MRPATRAGRGKTRKILTTLACTACTAGVLAAVPSGSATADSPAYKLRNGETLASGSSLTSANGNYRLTMKPRGNLVLTSTDDPSTNLWSTGTSSGKNLGARLVMQYRGNLVLVSPANQVLWSTGTDTDGANLVLHSDASVVVVDKGDVVWRNSSDTSSPSPAPTPTPTPVSSATVRADSWVSAHVSYSQSRYYSNKYGSYRTDCSGFVSMAWGLNSSYTTRTLPNISSVISKSALRTGDILNAYNYHTVLFDKWANSAHTQYWIYEESPSGGATHHVIPYPYYSGHNTGSFVPRRLVAKKVQQMSGRSAQMSQGSDPGPVDVP